MSRLQVLMVGLSMTVVPMGWSAGTGPRAGVSVGWNRTSANYAKRIKVSGKYKDTRTAFKDQIKKGIDASANVIARYKEKWPDWCSLEEGVHVDTTQGVFIQKDGHFVANEKIALFMRDAISGEIEKLFPCSLKRGGTLDVTVIGENILMVGPHPYSLSNDACGLFIDLVRCDKSSDTPHNLKKALQEGRFYPSFYDQLLDNFEVRVSLREDLIPAHELVGEDTLPSERNSTSKDGVAAQVSIGYNMVFRDFKSPAGFSFGADAFYEADFGKMDLKLPKPKIPVNQTPLELQTRHSVGVQLSPGVTFGPGNRYTVFVPVSLDLTRYHIKNGEAKLHESDASKWMEKAGIKPEFLCEMNIGKGSAKPIDQKNWKFGVSAGLGMEVAVNSYMSVKMSWQHSLGTRSLSFETAAYEGKNDSDIDRFGAQHDITFRSQKVVMGVLVRL